MRGPYLLPATLLAGGLILLCGLAFGLAALAGAARSVGLPF